MPFSYKMQHDYLGSNRPGRSLRLLIQVTSGDLTFNTNFLSGAPYKVYWGDGNIDRVLYPTYLQSTKATHTYVSPGFYTVAIEEIPVDPVKDFRADRFFDLRNINASGKVIRVLTWGLLRYNYLGASVLMTTPDYPQFYLDNVAPVTVNDYARLNFGGNLTDSDIPDNISEWNTSEIGFLTDCFASIEDFDKDISAWDTGNVTNLNFTFNGCDKFNANISAWNVSNVTDMEYTFAGATLFNQDLNSWDTSNVTDLDHTFADTGVYSVYPVYSTIPDYYKPYAIDLGGSWLVFIQSYSGDLTNWDTSKVTRMRGTFSDLYPYASEGFDPAYVLGSNVDISTWDTGNVTTFENMFQYNGKFVSDISAWNTSSAINMKGMFHGALVFNANIADWNTGNVTNMSFMFKDTLVFNQPIGSWNTSSVTTMEEMFEGAEAFNQDISSWDTGNVTTMERMFLNAENFNKNISSWDTSNVTNMDLIFNNAIDFNQPIGSWNTSSVTSIFDPFSDRYGGTKPQGTLAFNQSLAGWDVSNLVAPNFSGETGGYFNFNECSMSDANYDATLASWGTQTVNTGVRIDAVYNACSTPSGLAGRANLIAQGWIINDGT